MKKKIIAVICSIIMVIPLVLSTPKAAGASYNGNGTFSKGSYNYSFSVMIEQTEIGLNFGTEGVGLNIPWATGSSFTINFQFNDTYTGSIGFTLKSNTGVGYRLDQCLWAVDGGYFKQSDLPSLTTTSSSKTFVIYCYNTTNVSFTIVTDSVNTFHPNSTQFSGFGVQSFYYNLTDTADITDVNHNLDLYLPGMNTSLQNIASNTATMSSDIAIIKGYLDGLEGYTDQIEPLLNQIIDMSKVRNSIDIPIYSRFAYINLLRYGTISDQYNYPYSTAQYGFFPTILTSNYSAPSYNSDYDIDIPSGKTLHFIYTVSYWTNIFDFIDSNSNSINPTVNMIEGNNYYRTYDVSYTNNINSRLWVNVAMNRNVNRPVIPLYLGVNVPADVAMLFNMDFDNYYTRLLQQIANGVGGTAYDTSQYDQYEQTIDGLNDNMRDRFNSSESNFQNSINSILTPDQTAGGSNTIFERFHFSTINSVFTGFLSDIFTAAPAIQYVFLFGLLLLVLGVFI